MTTRALGAAALMPGFTSSRPYHGPIYCFLPMTLARLQTGPAGHGGFAAPAQEADETFRIVLSDHQVFAYSATRVPSFRPLPGLQGLGQDRIDADVFGSLARSAQLQATRTARRLTTSNATQRKHMWNGYLAAFIRISGALAPLDWPLAPAAVGAGIAKVGLDIDQAFTGSSAGKRREGAIERSFAGGDAPAASTAVEGAAWRQHPGVFLARNGEQYIVLDEIVYPVRYDATIKQWFIICGGTGSRHQR